MYSVVITKRRKEIASGKVDLDTMKHIFDITFKNPKVSDLIINSLDGGEAMKYLYDGFYIVIRV